MFVVTDICPSLSPRYRPSLLHRYPPQVGLGLINLVLTLHAIRRNFVLVQRLQGWRDVPVQFKALNFRQRVQLFNLWHIVATASGFFNVLAAIFLMCVSSGWAACAASDTTPHPLFICPRSTVCVPASLAVRRAAVSHATTRPV